MGEFRRHLGDDFREELHEYRWILLILVKNLRIILYYCIYLVNDRFIFAVCLANGLHICKAVLARHNLPSSHQNYILVSLTTRKIIVLSVMKLLSSSLVLGVLEYESMYQKIFLQTGWHDKLLGSIGLVAMRRECLLGIVGADSFNNTPGERNLQILQMNEYDKSDNFAFCLKKII